MSAFKTWLNGLTSKTTPVDADEMYLRDSVGAASNKVTWANLKATLLTYFDTAYLKLTGGTLAGGTVTASSPVLTTTQTWNNAAVTFVGKSTNITNTASAAGSIIEQWQVGGANKAYIKKDGTFLATTYLVNIPGGAASALMANDTNGLSLIGISDPNEGGSGTIGIIQSMAFGWTNTSYFNGTFDLRLYRDAANTLAQRNGTNAQAFRTYGTYTDASNYRRVALAMTTAGVATLAPEGAGTGASGNVLHISGLPTSNPGTGILWNDSGTVKVGT